MQRAGPLAAVLAAGLVAITLGAPPAPRAQSSVPRVGDLGYTSPASGAPYLNAFRNRLAELGLVDGRDVVVTERYVEGKYERLFDLAADLVREGVAVLVTPGPVAYRLVATLDRPGGNVTGVSSIFTTALYRHAAGYVARVLRGARPGDLPVEPPERYELVINLKTARAIGDRIPDSVVTRADVVID